MKAPPRKEHQDIDQGTWVRPKHLHSWIDLGGTLSTQPNPKKQQISWMIRDNFPLAVIARLSPTSTPKKRRDP